MTDEPLDFYFDFSSPYGYLASHRIDALARRHGRRARWHPFLLGVVFRVTGQSPLIGQNLRGPYHERDFARSARRLGVAFTMPSTFPFPAQAASRGFYWLSERDADASVAFAKTVYHAAFGEGQNVTDLDRLETIASSVGADRAEFRKALADPVMKDRLREETDSAIARGVFGSPFVFVDDEPFWGHDRFDQIDEWLQRGGW
ncbi:MAG: 2-hydroxychromene-2-carboxylate isomerase [Dongiaceae bacterium]